MAAIGSAAVSTAPLSHSSEKPCTSDQAASAAPSGSALALGSDECPDAAAELGARGGLGRDERGVGVVVERLVPHHRVVAGMVEGEPHICASGVDELGPCIGQRGRQQRETLRWPAQ